MLLGPLPSAMATRGVTLLGGSNSTIGGPAGAGNIIAFNLGSGVQVKIAAPASTGNIIFGNSIFGNGALGIDLAGGTEDANLVTANDFPDSDTGANNLQNYPVLNEIAVSGANRTLEGELNSNPNTDYVLDFYYNSEVDPSGFGEGRDLSRLPRRADECWERSCLASRSKLMRSAGSSPRRRPIRWQHLRVFHGERERAAA